MFLRIHTPMAQQKRSNWPFKWQFHPPGHTNMASINQSPFHKNSFCLGHHSFPVANNSARRANPLWQTSGQETILAQTMVPLNYAVIQMRSDIIHHDPDRADEKMEQVQRVFCCLAWPTAILLSQNKSAGISAAPLIWTIKFCTVNINYVKWGKLGGQ